MMKSTLTCRYGLEKWQKFPTGSDTDHEMSNQQIYASVCTDGVRAHEADDLISPSCLTFAHLATLRIVSSIFIFRAFALF